MPARPSLSDAAALDAALTLALDQSQDQLDVLQRERDEYRRKAVDKEAEVLRLSSQLEGAEAGRLSFLEEQRREAEERRRDGQELLQLRREHHEAREEAAALKAEALQARTSSEERRAALEQLVAEQRERLELLDEVGGQSSSLSAALYTCLRERAAMLRFLAELLREHHALLYNPPQLQHYGQGAALTPKGGRRGDSSARSHLRCRVSSCDRQSACGDIGSPCRWRCSSGATGCSGAADVPHDQPARRRASCGRLEAPRSESLGTGCRGGTAPSGGPSLSADLRELVVSLEAELQGSACGLQQQARRVAAEAEHAGRALAASRSASPPPNEPPISVGAPEKELAVQRTCAFWLEHERLRCERAGLPATSLAPRVDWAEEQAHHQMVTRAAESKFAQLAKLRRLLQARHCIARKRGGRG